jgi:RimJ/RimL family protein N-acetyltransferase
MRASFFTAGGTRSPKPTHGERFGTSSTSCRDRSTRYEVRGEPVTSRMEIRTDRLVLREWRNDDAEPHWAMSTDAAVMEHVGGPVSQAESDAMMDRCRARRATGIGPWAVEVPGVAPFVGFVGLARTSFEAPFTPCVEVMWRLAREHWGQGYAAEAARASLREGFELHGLDAIVSFTVPANVRSWQVMERIGMTRSHGEDFDHPLVPIGSPLRRHILYRIRREEWDAGAAKPPL